MKTDNTFIISALCAAYAAHCAANVHIIGFNVNGTVYAAEVPLDIMLSEFCGISLTSDEIPQKRLRLKPLTKKTTILFNSFNPFPLCSFDELTNRAQNECAGNRGIMFEIMCAEYYHGTLAEQNAPFWKCGDFAANGLEYQCKFQNASIIKAAQIDIVNSL